MIVNDGRWIGVVGSAMLLATALAGCSSTGFVDEDVAYRKENPETAVIRRMMEGLGAVDPNRKPIEYKPRSPLVVPPTRDLPSPKTESVETTHAGVWPKEPESVAAAQRRQYRDKIDERQRQSELGYTVDLTNEERAAFSSASKKKKQKGLTADLKTTDGDPDGPRPDEKTDTEKVATSTNDAGKPMRRTLVDPPIEYQTPSASAPMKAPEEKKKKWWKIL